MDDLFSVPDVREHDADYMVLESTNRRHDEGFDILDLHFRTMDDHLTLTVEGDNIPLALTMPMGKRLYVYYTTLYSGIAEGWNFDHIDRFVVCEQMAGPCPEQVADVLKRRVMRHETE